MTGCQAGDPNVRDGRWWQLLLVRHRHWWTSKGPGKGNGHLRGRLARGKSLVESSVGCPFPFGIEGSNGVKLNLDVTEV